MIEKAVTLKQLKEMVIEMGYEIITEGDTYFSFYNREKDILLYAQNYTPLSLNLSTCHKGNNKTGSGWVYLHGVWDISRTDVLGLEAFAEAKFISGKEKRITLEEYKEFYSK